MVTSPPASLRFGIDYEMEETELNRREACEKMLSGAPKKLMNIDGIHIAMQEKGFFYLQTYLDATVEYMDESTKDTVIYFQRDWTKRGYLHTPYRMCIFEPGHGTYYYRVRSIGRLKRVLNSWAAKHR